MWVLPTFGRPGHCQDALDSITASGSAPGVVVINGDSDPAYDALRLPPGWASFRIAVNTGVCEALQVAFARHPDEPWYGFITDDSIVRTEHFDVPLIAAAGRGGIANSSDGWQADRRLHGAVVFGGDLLRALGWWAPPGLIHCFVDDAWERIARALGNARHVAGVMVEHRHPGNGKAATDPTYTRAYASFEADQAAYLRLCRGELPAAIARAIPVVVGPDEQARRLARAKSRSVMIATPVARHPVRQYTVAILDTMLLLRDLGIPARLQWVIGQSNLPRARNELCAEFLASDCTDLLFVDDDMGWQANDVVRLLASPQPVIGGGGRKKDPASPDDAVATWCCRFAPGATEVVQDEMGAVEVVGIGTGFVKIARSVFERILAARSDLKRAGHASMRPEVRALYHRFFAFGDDGWNEPSEDYGFCGLWRELGGTVWADPTIALVHVGEREFTGTFAAVLHPADTEEMAA